MPIYASDFEKPKQPEQPRKQATSDNNPELQDGETYFGIFVGFSKPYEKEDKYNGGMQWRICLVYELDGVGRYKEFLKLSTFDGHSTGPKAYPQAPFFQRLVSLAGVKNETEAKRVDLDAIKNLRIRITAGKNLHGYIHISSLKVVQPSVQARPPAPSGGLQHVANTKAYAEAVGAYQAQQTYTAIPGTFEVPVTLDEVRAAFLGTGRSEVAFDAFLIVYGGVGNNVAPEACRALLKAIAGLPKVTPGLTAQASAAGLPLGEEEVPF
jgi:hypothetical protein